MRPGTFAVVLLALSMCAAVAGAQDFGSAFGGFSSSSDKPIQIEADRLEVRDAEKLAIYTGHVRVLQGDALLEAPVLRVFYTKDPEQGPSGGAAQGSIAGSQVTRLEAGPGVTVHSGDQVATADQAVFEMATDLVTMTGNVVLTQGENVVRGERLVVNLTTKIGRMEGGRVQTLITPSEGAGGQ
jgi:lipopolysaccharide export system protein LptA